MQTYEGTFKHPVFGADSIAITVTLEPTGNHGYWESLGQKEKIAVEWGDNNSVILGELTGVTKLKGIADHTGTISGTVIQRNKEGGHFELRTGDEVYTLPTYCTPDIRLARLVARDP